jgi:diguanylate cyclase (GGDEF)-like protein/PAS domain S-box-containing protein
MKSASKYTPAACRVGAWAVYFQGQFGPRIEAMLGAYGNPVRRPAETQRRTLGNPHCAIACHTTKHRILRLQNFEIYLLKSLPIRCLREQHEVPNRYVGTAALRRRSRSPETDSIMLCIAISRVRSQTAKELQVIAATVLVVEDERIIALDLKQRLTALGYQVLAVESRGEDALRSVGELHPQIVLMDIHLEGAMDGIETARQIYAEHRIPVVFLTAYADDETLSRASRSLPFGYLIKPFHQGELHATLQVVLTRSDAYNRIESSEQRLRFALDAGDLGVWEWDTATGEVTSVGSTYKSVDVATELVAESWTDFLNRLHPEDRASMDRQVSEAVERGGQFNRTIRTPPLHGQVRQLETHVKVFYASPSSEPRVVGIMRDVTERQQMEEQLRRSAGVFDATLEAIFILDAQQHIVSVNPAFTEITGYSAEEVLGLSPEAKLHARRHSDEFYPRLERSVEGRWQGETFCRRKDGTVFPAWESVSVVRDKDGAATHCVVAFSDISALRRVEDNLRHLAHHDVVTGLPNRVLLDDELERVLARAQREGSSFAVLFLDLDGFKSINDTLGHASGDVLLQSVALRIQGELRRTDMVARQGGDEFVMLLTRISAPPDAAQVAQKLLDSLSTSIQVGQEQITVSASIGVAVYPEDGLDRHTLLKAADTAMYHAKAQGRDRFAFHTKELRSRAAERMSTEQGLRRALEDEQLAIHYQPLIALHDGSVTGLEALLRWRHRERGLISPAHFIPIAEQSGLIEMLGGWVLKHATSQIRAWCNDTAPIRLAINVSARQFLDDGFADSVRRILAESGFPPQQLELEITETSLQVLNENWQLLSNLKALGLHIAIDDFGTGYSSLSALKHLPIDRLKIDRSFVRDLPRDLDDVAIVEAISTLCRTKHLSVTAEGVENPDQLTVLRSVGCDEGQGYLFCHPVPLADLNAVVAQRAWAHMWAVQ